MSSEAPRARDVPCVICVHAMADWPFNCAPPACEISSDADGAPCDRCQKAGVTCKDVDEELESPAKGLAKLLARVKDLGPTLGAIETHQIIVDQLIKESLNNRQDRSTANDASAAGRNAAPRPAPQRTTGDFPFNPAIKDLVAKCIDEHEFRKREISAAQRQAAATKRLAVATEKNAAETKRLADTTEQKAADTNRLTVALEKQIGDTRLIREKITGIQKAIENIAVSRESENIDWQKSNEKGKDKAGSWSYADVEWDNGERKGRNSCY